MPYHPDSDPLAPECGDQLVTMNKAEIKRLIAHAIYRATKDIEDHILALEEIITNQGEALVNVQEYAQAVDAETNRIAEALEALKQQFIDDEIADQAALDSAFAPVLERLRGVGVDGPTAPPAEEEPPAEPENQP